MLKETKKLMDEAAISRSLRRMASEILERHNGTESLAFVGIRTRGIHLARRLSELIEAKEGQKVPVGVMDITLYRDDVFQGLPDPEVGPTRLEFAVRDKKVVLVDDVLYTGRTIRAALDELMDFGRPLKVELAVLVDRGWRELPIQADYVGKAVETSREESVKVRLKEQDDDEAVVLRQKLGETQG